MLLVLSLLACVPEDTSAPDDPGAASPEIAVSAFCEQIASPLNDPPTFYEDNPVLPDSGGAGDLVYGEPADQGMDGMLLEQAAQELAGKPFANSLLVMRGGVVVMERYFNGAAADDSNNAHSSSKSALAVLVGIAIEEGHIEGIDQPVSELLPDLFEGLPAEKRGSTVGELLTMSAGFRWSEDESEYTLQSEPDWLQAIVELPLTSAPGEDFNYSTCQSHLLGAALAHATGRSLCDYAHDELLAPLGIAAERWGRDPQGYFSGGYNVYLTPRELLRFGQLVLDRGEYDGQRVAPAAWIDDAVSEQIYDAGFYWYGYYFWLWRPSGVQIDIAWGYGGQLIYTLPEHDLLVVITTNTNDYDPDYDGGDLVMGTIVEALE